MPKTHVCEKCGIKFSQKGHLTDHLQKKNDCAKKTDLIRIIEEKVDEKVEEKLKVIRVVQPPKEVTIEEVTIENLPSFFEDLHNLLWNKVGLNPENALKHMNLFFAYRMLDLQKDKLNLPDVCRWSELIKLSSAEMLDQAIKKGIVEFRRSYDIVKPFFFQHEVKKVQIIHDIVHLINRITLATLQQTDTLGDIFEYMIGRGMSTMADEGQYFTNRTICKLAFKLAFGIKKELRRPDGTLCTFADWFCGTGGFTIEYIKGVTKNLADIDWKKDKHSIYSQDQNDSSVTTTLLNTLITTGEPFLPKTIRMGNSFAEPITRGNGAPFPGLVIDYCFMNPPYGGDKSKGKDYKFAYAKGKGNEKTYLVNQDIQSIGIEDDDKVSAGVQLAMATLSEGGVCCIVLPQGFFFGASKKCVELRKKIAEDYKIWSIVDIASGSFLNTGTKTSMMVFQKGVGATETVTFMGLNEAVLVEATLEELRVKNYSLNYKQYLPQSAVEVDGFEMVKLGSIAKKLTTRGKHSAKDTIENGKYSLFSSSINEIYKLDIFDYAETCCIINSTNASGNAVVNLGKNFSVTSDTFVFKCENDVTTIYIQIYLSNNIHLVKETFQGANHKHPTWDRLSDIQIPLPSLEKQQEIVEQIDFYTQMAHTEEQSLKILEKIVMGWVKEMGRGKDRVKLGDIVKPFSMKHRSTTDGNKNGKYPLISSALNVEYFMDTFDSDTPSLIFNTINADGNCSVHYYQKFNTTSNTYVLTCENIITLQYLYYYLRTQPFTLKDCFEGTTKKALSRPLLQSIEIPLPTLAEQQTLQSDFDEIRHKHAKIAEYRSKAQEAIQRLIPGAKADTQKSLASSSEAHSSTCKRNEDGTGCTCKSSRPVASDEEDEEEEEEKKPPRAEKSKEVAAKPASGSGDLTKTELSKKTVPELREIAKNLAVKLPSKIKKDELVKIILEKQAGK